MAAQVGLANATAQGWLDTIEGTTYTAPTACWARMHNGHPGIDGTANVATGVTGYQQITGAEWDAATVTTGTATKTTQANPASWSCGGTDTLTHVSFWSSDSAGTFLFSAALSASKAVSSGDTFTLTSVTVTLAP